MNTRIIEPITVFTTEGPKEVSLLSLVNFCGYNFLNSSGIVSYILSGLINVDGVDSYVEYIHNTLEVPAEIVQQWGSDDEIIFDYVATALGLTMINYTSRF
jgi:hypothetical protein